MDGIEENSTETASKNLPNIFKNRHHSLDIGDRLRHSHKPSEGSIESDRCVSLRNKKIRESSSFVPSINNYKKVENAYKKLVKNIKMPNKNGIKLQNLEI